MITCEHTWRLAETGYVRTWNIEMDEESKVITAYQGWGSSNFSEQGNGDDHLECSLCLETKEIPDDWEVDFQ